MNPTTINFIDPEKDTGAKPAAKIYVYANVSEEGATFEDIQRIAQALRSVGVSFWGHTRLTRGPDGLRLSGTPRDAGD